MAADYRDLALEHAAADHVELLVRVADLEAELGMYRELLSIALTQAHKRQREIKRLLATYRVTLNELRAVRQSVRAVA